MAGHGDTHVYDDSVFEDETLPRTATLEDYVRYKPARRRKGESPKRPQGSPSAAPGEAREATENNGNNGDLHHPIHDIHPVLVKSSVAVPDLGLSDDDLYKMPEDVVAADGDFRYRAFPNGKCMILQWQAAGMRWRSLGVVDRNEAEIFQQVEKEHPQYVLPNGHLNKLVLRAHIEHAVHKITHGVKKGGLDYSPASLVAPTPSPAQTSRLDGEHHARQGQGLRPNSAPRSSRRAVTPARPTSYPLSQRLALDQTATSTGPRSFSKDSAARPPATFPQADPFVSSVSSTTPSCNPSVKWLQEHQQWRDRESQRIGASYQHSQFRDYEHSHKNPTTGPDALGGHAPLASSAGPVVRPYLATSDPSKPVPQREELRRTVLHDPYRQPQAAPRTSSPVATTPVTNRPVAIEDIPFLWPSSGGSTLGCDVPFPQPLNKINPLPPPVRTANPWASEAFKLGRGSIPAPIASAVPKDVDETGSSHHPDGDVCDFSSPTDPHAAPVTEVSALYSNADVASVKTGQALYSDPPQSYNGQNARKNMVEAAKQRQVHYEDRLHAFWMSGRRDIPSLQRQVEDAIKARNASLRPDQDADKVVADDEMILWSMLHAQFESYVDEAAQRRHSERSNHSDAECFNLVPRNSVLPGRFVTPAEDVVDVSDHKHRNTLFAYGGPIQGDHENHGHDRKQDVANDDGSEEVECQWTSEAHPRVALPGFFEVQARAAA